MEGDSRKEIGEPMPIAPHSTSSAGNGDKVAAEASTAANPEHQQAEQPINAGNTQLLLEGLSKNAQKRLLKRAKHDETKKDRRREAKERKRAKKAEEKEQQQQAVVDAGGAASGSDSSLKKSVGIEAGSREGFRDKNGEKEREQKPYGAGLVIDLGFDEVMSERECASMAVQLTYLYASNKSSRMPMSNITLVGRGKDKDCFEYSTTTSTELQSPHPSFFVHHRMLEATEHAAAPSDSNGQSDQIIGSEGRLSLRRSRIGHMKETQDDGSWNRWQRITIQDQGGLETIVAGHESDFVYLSADAENVITELDEGKNYIIGGLVDRNRYKNICLNKANALKIPAARLPLDEAQLGGKKVLAVNHVVDILLAWIETRDWDSAVERGLPGRRAKLENGMQPESVQRRRRKGERAQVGPRDEKDSPHVDAMPIDEFDEEEAFNSSSRLSQ